MSVTLADVARHAGVSKKTASRVINNEARVAPETRLKVLNAIEELGFVPNVWAQRLARGHSGNIGLLVDDASSPYIMSIVEALLDGDESADYRVSLYRFIPDNPEHINHIQAMTVQNRVEGLIFTPPCDNASQLIDYLIKNNFPFVLLTPVERRDDCMWVSGTDEVGSFEATHHLIELGHRNIAFLQGPTNHKASWDRLNGFKKAMQQNGLAINAMNVIPGGNYALARKNTPILLQQEYPPTAILAWNDEAAAGVIQSAWGMGIRCPEQLSIIGYDNVPLAEQLCPPLTTVRQPIYEIATSALTLLTSQLSGNTTKLEQIIIPTELIMRQSTAPPRVTDR